MNSLYELCAKELKRDMRLGMVQHCRRFERVEFFKCFLQECEPTMIIDLLLNFNNLEHLHAPDLCQLFFEPVCQLALKSLRWSARYRPEIWESFWQIRARQKKPLKEQVVFDLVHWSYDNYDELYQDARVINKFFLDYHPPWRQEVVHAASGFCPLILLADSEVSWETKNIVVKFLKYGQNIRKNLVFDRPNLFRASINDFKTFAELKNEHGLRHALKLSDYSGKGDKLCLRFIKHMEYKTHWNYEDVPEKWWKTSTCFLRAILGRPDTVEVFERAVTKENCHTLWTEIAHKCPDCKLIFKPDLARLIVLEELTHFDKCHDGHDHLKKCFLHIVQSEACPNDYPMHVYEFKCCYEYMFGGLEQFLNFLHTTSATRLMEIAETIQHGSSQQTKSIENDPFIKNKIQLSYVDDVVDDASSLARRQLINHFFYHCPEYVVFDALSLFEHAHYNTLDWQYEVPTKTPLSPSNIQSLLKCSFKFPIWFGLFKHVSTINNEEFSSWQTLSSQAAILWNHVKKQITDKDQQRVLLLTLLFFSVKRVHILGKRAQRSLSPCSFDRSREKSNYYKEIDTLSKWAAVEGFKEDVGAILRDDKYQSEPFLGDFLDVIHNNF